MSAEPAAPSRVVLVTGGSGGIGRAVCGRLARDGYAVAVHYAGSKATAEEVAGELTAAGGQAITVGGDIADEAAMSAAFDETEAAFGRIDVLAHTAGIMRLKPIADLDLAELDEVYRVNIRGTFVVCQQAVRRLHPGGAIVNFSSSVVGLQFAGYGAYTASKGAVEALTLVLARELRGRDITVNGVAPGPTATPLMLRAESAEAQDRLARQSPLERLGQPDDIAEVVAFLASPAGHWVNGQVVRANGGMI